MVSLRKFVTPEFVFGRGARFLAGQYAANFGGTRVLLVSDPGVVAAGWAGDVQRSIEESGLGVSSFFAVSSNPRAEEVMLGGEAYLSQGCDIIVAVGGGSPMDCAKGISVVTTSRADIRSFEGVDKVGKPGAPLICIPTTAGTAADLSQFAIITDRASRRKLAIVSKAVVPDISLIDPETTATMPAGLTAATGLDALVHAVEAFVSLGHSPLLDLHCLEAIRLIREFLPKARSQEDDLESREHVMRASLHAGIAFSNASLGAVHAMAHSLGGLLDLPHGECNALLLDHVIPFNYRASPERFDRIAEALELDLRGVSGRLKAEMIAEEIRRFRQELGLQDGLARRGVRPGHLRDLARNALVDACIITNPRPAAQRDVEVIFEEAM